MWRKTAGESARSPLASYPLHRRHRPRLRHLPRRCCCSDHSALQAEHGQATGSVQLPLGLLLQRRELEPLQLLSLACCFGSASSLKHHRVELSRWTHSATIGAPHHDQLNDAALPILPKQAPSANGKPAETIIAVVSYLGIIRGIKRLSTHTCRHCPSAQCRELHAFQLSQQGLR